MPNKVNINLTRKIATSGWIIKARWVYMFGVLLIGFLTKIISHSNVDFSFVKMILLLMPFTLINLALYFGQKRVEKNFSPKLLSLISYAQITLELFFLVIIMNSAGGIESISTVFFFMPVVSASLLFGSRGAISVAIISSFLINSLVVMEYYGIVNHVYRYGVPTIEFQSLPIALTKTVTTSIFYLIIGSFSGYGANMLFERERLFEEKTHQLNEQTKKINEHSKELAIANKELDEKVAELERFHKLAVGRELKMIELKEEIKKIKEN
ncbi:MAG: hypothetical protein WC349_04675 [Patescibacteria group bacterium]